MQDLKAADLLAARGVALREFELTAGCGTAVDLLRREDFMRPALPEAIVRAVEPVDMLLLHLVPPAPGRSAADMGRPAPWRHRSKLQ